MKNICGLIAAAAIIIPSVAFAGAPLADIAKHSFITQIADATNTTATNTTDSSSGTATNTTDSSTGTATNTTTNSMTNTTGGGK